MKKITLLSAIACMQLCVTATGNSPCLKPKTIFVPRSQSENAARDLVGIQRFINQPKLRDIYGVFAGTLEYTRSFKPDLITSYLFGPAARCGRVTFSGSKVAARGNFDFLADYFGLPQDFKSIVCFAPRIQNILFDLSLYVGLDQCARGTYFRIHAPIVYTRWDLNAKETIMNPGDTNFPLGYMAQEEVERAQLPSSALDALNGCTIFGDMQQPLKFGKIAPCGRSKTTLSDVFLVLGYNFIYNDCAHAGFNIIGVLPAGNKPNAQYLFEPIVGNSGHFELGVGFTSRYTLWQRDACSQSLVLYCDINATHLFGSRQIRSFDLANNCSNSRYILAAEFTAINRNDQGNNPTGSVSNAGAQYEYAGSLFNAINFTTQCCNVSVQVQADAVLKLAYTRDNFEFDLGYNFWGRSKERVTLLDTCNNDLLGLKGDAFMYGAVDPTNPAANNPITARAAYNNDAPNSRIPLAATQSQKATIYSGSNYVVDAIAAPELNPGVDSPERAETRSNPNNIATEGFVYSPIAGVGDPVAPSQTAINTSNPPSCIGDLDVESAASPSVMTNKIFANIAYYFCPTECHYVEPFVSGGLEIEFDTSNNADCSSCSCPSALNQWGVWVKGGFGF